MNYKHLLANAAFLTSASTPNSLPPDQGKEIAFAGRSNAGKSSTINCLCSQKQLARTSKTPGRTQLINFFTISETDKLADLPGYGYAKASQSKQRQWLELLEFYFTYRKALQGTIIVMDVRHPFTEADKMMVEWCVHHQCEIHILLNKADKLSRNQAKNQLHSVQRQLKNYDISSTSLQLFSAQTGQGIDDAVLRISQWLES